MALNTQEIAEFEFKGNEYLFNLDPATGNLFYLESIRISTDSQTAEGNTVSGDNNPLRYRVKSLKLDNTIGIEYDQNRVLLPGNPICVTGIKEAHSVVIEWVEDSFFRVQKFHQEWISNWFQNKTLKDGLKGKLIDFHFIVFYFDNHQGTLSPNLQPKVAYEINLNGCAPTDLSDFSFSYDEQDNGKSFVGKYFVKEILISGASGEAPTVNEDTKLVFSEMMGGGE